MTVGPEWAKGIKFISGNPKKEGDIVMSLDDPASLPIGDVYWKQIEPKWFITSKNLINDPKKSEQG